MTWVVEKECKDFLRDSSVEFSMFRSGTKVYTEKEIVRQGIPDRIFFRTGYLGCVGIYGHHYQDNKIASAIKEQKDIGWDHFMLGRISQRFFTIKVWGRKRQEKDGQRNLSKKYGEFVAQSGMVGMTTWHR